MKRKLSSSLTLKESQPSSMLYMKKKQESNIPLAVISGFFATIGSLLGKLAGGADVDSTFGLLLKGVLLILMIISNTVGYAFFVKALNASGSSLPCTITSAATSYICSALTGSLIFNESTSLTWWCGISFVILGLLVISCTQSKDHHIPSLKRSKSE
ncbi:transmembrane protein 42 [Bombus vosnesenskii]|uniref:Transmembrane protein 42 n=1 Tax=Bombus vosnesenskii TaxID=207650 RepID=A0A6J3KK90_9HYME|nr:transmembrane protein 42 [Bombus vosnesenskii]XP_033353596.1 transmembrane protein 42 [Bombus vosnesenskii]